MEHPLAGYRIIDLGQIYNGPYCTLLLALLGAEVIKVEPLQGEIVRHRDPEGSARCRANARAACQMKFRNAAAVPCSSVPLGFGDAGRGGFPHVIVKRCLLVGRKPRLENCDLQRQRHQGPPAAVAALARRARARHCLPPGGQDLRRDIPGARPRAGWIPLRVARSERLQRGRDPFAFSHCSD